MSSPRIFGRAVIFSMNNASIITYGYAMAGGYILQNAAFTGVFNIVPLLTADGDTIGAKVCNSRATCTIEMIPVGRGAGTSNTVAAASSMIQLPPPLSLVRLYNFPGYVNGFWNYSGQGSFRMDKGQVAVMVLPLIRFDSIDARNLSPVRIRR